MAINTRAAACLVVACIFGAAHAREAPRSELAYLAVSDGYWEVWASNSDGSHARQLTRSKNDKSRVSWLPGGKTLLASRNDGTVVTIDMEGRETRIALEQAPIVDAVASPDGKRIAFSFSTAIDGNDIWTANLDGTGAQKIVRMTTLQHEPVWSSDGQSIYFLSGDGGQAHDIWRVSLQSRNTEQITVGSLYNFDVAISTAGDLAFSSNRSGNYEVYLQRPGKQPEALTSDPALDARPAFSPDTSQIAFESTRGGSSNLWLLDIGSKSTKQITRHRDGARAPVWYSGAQP